jgi:hypothetical protein
MSKKKSKRTQSNLSRVLASSNSTQQVLINYFRLLTPSEIRRSVPQLRNHRHFRIAIPRADHEFNTIHAAKLSDQPLEKCLPWCLGILEANKEVVQFFLDAQSDLLNGLLKGNFSDVANQLDAIHSKAGYTTWEISLRGALFSLQGLDGKQEYLRGLILAAGNNGLLKNLVMNLVARFDDPETLESESRFFEQKIKRTFSGSLLDYLMYKLLPRRIDVDYNLESILNFEKDSTATDIFIALFDWVTFNIESSNSFEKELCIYILSDLRNIFRFDGLDILAISFGEIPYKEIGQDELDIVDLYTAGRYADVDRRMSGDSRLFLNFSLVEIWAKATSRLDEYGGGSFHLLDPIRNIIRKTDGYEKSKAVVLNYCHSLESLTWFREMRFLLERETKYYGADLNARLKKASRLLSNLSTPGKLQYLENAIPGIAKEGDQSITKLLYAQTKSGAFPEAKLSELQSVEPLRLKKSMAAWNISQGNYKTAISILEELTQSQDILIKQEASRKLVEAYRSTGQVERAASVYVEAVLENQNLTSTFDTSGLAEACVSIIAISSSIYIPIVLSLYSNLIDERYSAALKFSFERFLKNNEISDPLDVLKLQGITTGARNYFLRYVCTPEVMKLYMHFENATSIEASRISICQELISTVAHTEPLLFEIKNRTRRLVLREAANQVQGSKIFSDANFVTGPNSGAFRALFERYRALQAQDISPTEDDSALAGLLAIMKGDSLLSSVLHTVHLQDLALNEKNSVFLRLCKLMRDEFTFGERGLNVYLSTRIRHGYFPNTIRKPLRDNNLLATKVNEKSGYRAATNINEKFGISGESIRLVENELVELSTKFNELVDEVNDRWLRIFTVDPDISGLAREGKSDQSKFNFSISAVESYYLQSQLNRDAEFADFVSLTNAWLWSRVERSLVSIREYLTGDMKKRALEMVDSLSKNLTHHVGIENLGTLPDAIARARGGLVQVFETVPNWFTRAQTGVVAKYDLDMAVQIAKLSADVQVEFHDHTGIFWVGESLTPAVDIFYLLFENCSSKSRLSKTSLSITAGAELLDDHINIWVKNNCECVSSISDSNEKLLPYKMALSATELSMDKAQGEGGTGLLKIRRILEKDMSVHPRIEVGYESNDEFGVSIRIPIEGAKELIYYEPLVN